MKKFSIVVPVYQNEKNLPDTIPALLKLSNSLSNYVLELVFVNDGSTDKSREILTRFSQDYPDTIKVISLTRNFGQTPATQAGLYHATGDCVGIISCDLQDPYEKFIDMIAAWEKGAKFVMGERAIREEDRWHQITSNTYWQLIRHLAFPNFPSMGYDFCLLDRQIANDINKINEKNSSIFVLIYWLGYAPVRLPIRRTKRSKGKSGWQIANKVSFTIDTLIGFTYLPSRLITITGFFVAIFCIVYFFFMLSQWYILRQAPPGWATVVGLLTLLGAAILFALGIISEYLLRILDEVRKRPPYVVDDVISNNSS